MESAVIGGRERWRRRLAGLSTELNAQRKRLSADDPESPRLETLARRARGLEALQQFSEPLLDALDTLDERPEAATWGEWSARLTGLAQLALRQPASVLRVLAELHPMATVGPVPLAEVRAVLGERLGELRDPPSLPSGGAVFVGTPEEARGLAHRVVFVPGLAEKVFPQKVTEDPILLDAERSVISPVLRTQADRVAEERLHLHLAVGSATERLVASWPRLDTERARPRVPSFYALELVRAATGTLPDFEALLSRADGGLARRLGWPAPEEPGDAIDPAEYDLALLGSLTDDGSGRRAEPDRGRGRARYLLDTNAHLARALRARARRHRLPRFGPDDGFIAPGEIAAQELASFALGERPYSATALERYARCPYQFYLRSLVRLAPREVPTRAEGMDALTRGSLIHEAQFRILRRLRDEGELRDCDPGRLPYAREVVAEELAGVDAEYREQLAPAITEVWRAHLDAIAADLLEWIALTWDERSVPGAFEPAHFELSFGLGSRAADQAHDEASRADPVELPIGLKLRGSIDLVERDAEGRLRATDYKTGRNRTRARLRIQGGLTLQPALYGLALRALFPEADVRGGRLYFCTSRGGYTSNHVALDEVTESAAREVVEAISGALREGFLPPTPRRDAWGVECERCDYRMVCGPDELGRVARKHDRALQRSRLEGEAGAYGRRANALRLLRSRE